MIKILLNPLTTILSIVVLSSIYSCKENDLTNPELSLYKDSIDTILLNSKLIDPGAKAIDNLEGDISPQISSDYLTLINKDSVGLYSVTYKVTDKAGNVNIKKRKVFVKNEAIIWEGNYTAYDTIVNSSNGAFTYKKYNVSIVSSWNKNREFLIKGFGKFTAIGYPSINLIGVIEDSSNVLTKANIPLTAKPLENLTFSAATSCATSSHKIKSIKSFYRYSGGKKDIVIYYEDEVYEPISCISQSYGKLVLKFN